MEIFAALPFYKPSDKAIRMYDANHEQVGYIQRIYKNRLNRAMNHLPVSLLETTNIIGEQEGYRIDIQERSFKANLLKLKWDVHVETDGIEQVFLLEDLTKIGTDPLLAYHKNELRYLLKKQAKSQTWQISIEDSIFICAEIAVQKRGHIKITLNTDDLTAIEVFGMYYMSHLVY